jgi:hypothetical protein
LAGLGLAVQLLAVPLNFNYLYERHQAAHPDVTIQQVMRDPADGPLVLAARAWAPTFAGGFAALGAPGSAEAYRQRAQFVPDFWWWLQALTPLPRWLIGLAVALLTALAAFAFARLRASAAADPTPAPPAPAP